MPLHSHIITITSTSHVTRAGYITALRHSLICFGNNCCRPILSLPSQQNVLVMCNVTFLNLIAGDILPIA